MGTYVDRYGLSVARYGLSVGRHGLEGQKITPPVIPPLSNQFFL